MRFELRCHTDAGTHVLFDPAAVPHLTRETYAQWSGKIAGQVGSCNLIAYSYGGDGDMDFVVFVDEPVNDDLAKRADEKATGVVRVPSGQLAAGGLEHIGRPGCYDAHALPAGNYEVTAYDLDWGDLPEREAEDAAKRANPARAKVVRWLGPLTGVLVLGTLLAIVFALGVWGMATRAESWELARRFGPWLIAPWLIVIVVWKLLPGGPQAEQARAEVYRRYPGAVVALSRLDDGVDLSTRTGCQFGVGLR